MTQKASLLEDISFNDNRPAVKLMLESGFSKEIRIAFKPNQIMKEHQTSYPIVVQIMEGKIDFGLEGEIITLKKGDMIALDGNVAHDLKAREKSIVRLSLSKFDSTTRVKEVVDKKQ